MWGITSFAILKFAFGFSSKAEVDTKIDEGNHRLMTLFAKNKYGYQTRIMSDFEMFLEAALNDKFIDNSTKYYNDPFTTLEIEDTENGLVNDFSQSDIRHLNKDSGSHDHTPFLSLANPDRVGTNYEKSDALSCYKILPKGQKPIV